MKHWRETAALFTRVARLAEVGERAAIATVVRITGSAYRRPGAKFLVERDGHTNGGVSGGCLEADVRETALALLPDGAPRLLHYDTGADDETVWGLGLGCEGTVEIFVQPVGADFARGPGAEALAAIAFGTAFGTAEPFALETAIKGAGIGTVRFSRRPEGASRIEERGADTVFVDVLRPPPVLLIFGAGDDARPLATLAAETGFEVTVVDHRPGYLTPERFPAPARLVLRRSEEGVPELGRQHFAVVQTHSLQRDREWLRALLPQRLAYLGLLGPRGRKEELLKQLGAAGAERLFAPVGLDLAAEGPEQVAVSIVAEMLAVLAGRTPVHLRERRGGIHEG